MGQQNFWPEPDTFALERQLMKSGYLRVAGIDEAGRGPLAGPVVAACVILPPGCPYGAYLDSKQLAAARRQELHDELRGNGAIVGVGVVSEAEIDRINILQASLLAMKRSTAGLPCRPDFLLVDGKFPVPVTIPQQPLVKGESKSASIAAASIIAKVTRDAMMAEYHRQFPVYNFKKNKGYPTAEHRRAIREHGPCAIHRRSFKGVREFIVGPNGAGDGGAPLPRCSGGS